MKKVFRAHPLMIIDFVKPFLFILVFPFLKGALQYLITKEVSGVLTLELIAFAAVAVMAGLRFRAFRVICDSDTVIIEMGFFIKSRSVINVNKLSSVETEQNPLDMIFRSITYRINTEAGRIGGTDFEFKLGVRDSHMVSHILFGDKNPVAVKFSVFKVAVMAATTSSAFTGMVVGVPLINRAGKLLGIAIDKMLLDEINSVSGKIESYFPPIVNTITLVLLLAYGVSFVYSFLKNINFRLFLECDNLEVRSGFFVRRRILFKKKAVNCVLIEQTPLMRIFRQYAMRVSVGGYNNTKSRSAILVPAARREEIKGYFSAYFPFLSQDGKAMRAKKDKMTISRFLFLPGIFFLVTVSVAVIAALIFPDFGRLILFLMIIGCVVIIYYAALSLFEYRYEKLKIGENIRARSIRGFDTCGLYCPTERVGQIKVVRNPSDRAFGTCSVTIYVRSENADRIRLALLKYDEVKESIFESYGLEV